MSTGMPTLGIKPLTAQTSRACSVKEHRKRRRIALPPMYSAVVVRVLSEQAEPIEGHALNMSESGIAVELDRIVPPGSPVTVEFTVSGLGRARPNDWPVFVAAAEVLRHDDMDDFPGGPYKTALRFVKIPTMVQAQIARYIASHDPPGN